MPKCFIFYAKQFYLKFYAISDIMEKILKNHEVFMKKYSDIVKAIEKIDKEHSFANIFEVIKSYKNLVAFETMKNKKCMNCKY